MTRAARDAGLPGQVVLVLQGGGALGAYQVGVYQALSEAGIEPDWVIGTSIGAINAALIAGNRPHDRCARLAEFWQEMQREEPFGFAGAGALIARLTGATGTMLNGIPGFFRPNPHAWAGMHAPVGAERAAYYCTDPLRTTLDALLNAEALGGFGTRLTVGAVNVNSGEMRYFDSSRQSLSLDHVVASGALPPAFPAVRIEGEPYWDGGIFSNTPIEAVLDDSPRRDSLIFTVNVWHHTGPEPTSIWQVMGRQKDIQFASRADSHIARQKQIHRLRHIIRELGARLDAADRATPEARELLSWGCGTVMHVVHLLAPRLEGEDHTKDIDFTPAGIAARRMAGYRDTLAQIEARPWSLAADPIEGVVEHR